MCEVLGLKSQNHKWRLKQTPRKTECGETIEQEESSAKQQSTKPEARGILLLFEICVFVLR